MSDTATAPDVMSAPAVVSGLRINGIDLGELPTLDDPGDTSFSEYGYASMKSAEEESDDDADSAEAEDTPPAATAPATETPKAEEPKAEAKPDEAALLTERATAMESLEKRWADSPVAFLTSLRDQLSQEQYTNLLKSWGLAEGAQTPQAAAEEDEDDDASLLLSPEEKFIKKHKGSIEAFAPFQQQVSQALSQRDVYINAAMLENNVLRAQVAALAEAVGVTLDAPDYDALSQSLRGGKAYDQAVEELYTPKLKQSVSRQRQAQQPNATPKTPMNGSAQKPAPNLKSLSAIMKWVDENGMR